MHLLIRSYDLLELQRLRSELAARHIDVYMSDEFTYAIPGLPGAEQPRALWVTEAADLEPARRVISDLVGVERLEPDSADTVPAGDGDIHHHRPWWGTHANPWSFGGIALISGIILVLMLTLF